MRHNILILQRILILLRIQILLGTLIPHRIVSQRSHYTCTTNSWKIKGPYNSIWWIHQRHWTVHYGTHFLRWKSRFQSSKVLETFFNLKIFACLGISPPPKKKTCICGLTCREVRIQQTSRKRTLYKEKIKETHIKNEMTQTYEVI